MIDFQEARRLVNGAANDFGVERIPLSKGIGRVLREDWYCDRDLPPYNRVTMDGIAVRHENALRNRTLEIEGVIAAGDPVSVLNDPDQCVEIMTGAVLPKNADTIIRYEDLTITDGSATINEPFSFNQNIHWRGEDRKKGDLLVPSGTLLSSSEIGVGASIGKSEISVSKHPRTIIISTGDELVEIDQVPLPHQIRRGNIYRTQSTLAHLGIDSDTAHLNDDHDEIVRRLTEYINEYDLIILSGGVSKGKFDFLPTALEQCGVVKLFHRVAQRPGKPLWFGAHPKGVTVFALPGNPISSFMSLHIYLIDWLRICFGLSAMTRPMGVLSEEVIFKPDLTYFLEVKLEYSPKGQILATPMKGNGSGDLANLLNGDAFIQLPRGQNIYPKGGVHPVFVYR